MFDRYTDLLEETDDLSLLRLVNLKVILLCSKISDSYDITYICS